MKISKNSWHYKMINWYKSGSFGYEVRVGMSDCQYIRKVIGFLILSVCVALMASLGLWVVISAYVLMPIYLIFDVAALNPFENGGGFFGPYIIFVVIVWTLSGFALIGRLAAMVMNRIEDYTERKRYLSSAQKPKPDSIIKSYLKAKKDKICSRVEII